VGGKYFKNQRAHKNAAIAKVSGKKTPIQVIGEGEKSELRTGITGSLNDQLKKNKGFRGAYSRRTGKGEKGGEGRRNPLHMWGGRDIKWGPNSFWGGGEGDWSGVVSFMVGVVEQKGEMGVPVSFEAH